VIDTETIGYGFAALFIIVCLLTLLFMKKGKRTDFDRYWSDYDE
jgi:hypothetical protein